MLSLFLWHLPFFGIYSVKAKKKKQQTNKQTNQNILLMFPGHKRHHWTDERVT